MTPLTIRGLSTCPHTQRPLVILEDEGHTRRRVLHLPLNEANRHARTVLRPPDAPVAVFDLVEILLRRLGATVARHEVHPVTIRRLE